MEKETLKLKRHETFSIREGWIEKGVNIIKSNSECFKKNEGPVNFGLGTNMCKSLRYWLISSKLADFKNGDAYLTCFGELIYKYDKYLEDLFSWWIIHLYLVNNREDAPIINSLFNTNLKQFEKDLLFSNLKEKLSKKYIISSDASLESDISIALKSYCFDYVFDPENNLQCPLAKLGLLNLSGKIYYKKSPTFYSLDYRVVYFSLLKCLSESIKNNKVDYNVEDIYEMENNPIAVLNISKSSFFVYLEEMKNNNLIKFIKTAGLNTIRFEKILTIEEIFESYFGGN